MDKILTIITSKRFKGIAAIVGAVIMHFAPDHIDEVVQGVLISFGIPSLVIKKKD